MTKARILTSTDITEYMDKDEDITREKLITIMDKIIYEARVSGYDPDKIKLSNHLYKIYGKTDYRGLGVVSLPGTKQTTMQLINASHIDSL